MTKGDILRVTFKTLVSSALLGILLVLPLMLMQLVNRRDFHEEFPFVLLAGLWLGLFAHPLHLIIVVALSSLFAVGLVFLIADQWPCFIGVPNCD